MSKIINTSNDIEDAMGRTYNTHGRDDEIYNTAVAKT
jgi:hypothetical protein